MKVREKIETFVDREIELEESYEQTPRAESRTHTLNLYEQLFNIVISANIDLLEVISSLYLHWDNPWGGLVTVKLTCNQV